MVAQLCAISRENPEKTVTAASRQPKSRCCELPCSGWQMLQLLPVASSPLPVADAGCLWLITPSTSEHFGGLSQALGTCQPPSRGRLALAVPACRNDAACPRKFGTSGDAGSTQCAQHVLEGAWSGQDPADSHFRPLQSQAASFLLPSHAGPAPFGKQ